MSIQFQTRFLLKNDLVARARLQTEHAERVSGNLAWAFLLVRSFVRSLVRSFVRTSQLSKAM